MRSLKLIAAVAALAVLPSVARAQTTITACYVPKSGSVYRIKVDGAPAKCAQNHVEFSWETGAEQLYGYVTQVEESVTIAAGAVGGATAACPEGSIAIAGGFLFAGDPSALNVQVLSSIRLNLTPGWFGSARNLGADPVEFEVHAQCIVYNL